MRQGHSVTAKRLKGTHRLPGQLKNYGRHGLLKNRLNYFLTIGLIFLCARSIGAEHPELKAFPDAGEGIERLVIVLPDKERE